MEEWVTITQAREALGVARSTIYRYSKSGKLPIYNRVGKAMIKKADLEKLLNDVNPLHPNGIKESENDT